MCLHLNRWYITISKTKNVEFYIVKSKKVIKNRSECTNFLTSECISKV